MRFTPQQSITRWLAWFSGTLAVVAGILISLGPAGQEATDVATVALNKTGGDGFGNEYIAEDKPQCQYDTCINDADDSYKCMDPGAQLLSQEPPLPDYKDYERDEYSNCFPQYHWVNTQNCGGAPDITDEFCSWNRWYYVDP